MKKITANQHMLYILRLQSGRGREVYQPLPRRCDNPLESAEVGVQGLGVVYLWKILAPEGFCVTTKSTRSLTCSVPSTSHKLSWYSIAMLSVLSVPIAYHDRADKVILTLQPRTTASCEGSTRSVGDSLVLKKDIEHSPIPWDV